LDLSNLPSEKRQKLEIILILLLDVETSGLDPYYCNILQLSCLFVARDKQGKFVPIEDFNSYIKRTGKLSDLIETLTGILSFEKPQSQLKNCSVVSRSFTSFKKKILEIQNNLKPWLVTIPFDLRFIKSECQKSKISDFHDLYHKIDTKQYCESIRNYPHPLSLTNSANLSLSQTSVYKALFDTDPPNAHNSYFDCLNLLKILNHPLFPSILEPSPPKYPRCCSKCGSQRHTIRSRCSFYV